jgi:hypothetical protein
MKISHKFIDITNSLELMKQLYAYIYIDDKTTYFNIYTNKYVPCYYGFSERHIKSKIMYVLYERKFTSESKDVLF